MIIKNVKLYDKNVSRFLFNLRNKKYVRKYSINKKIIKYKHHEIWFKNFLKKKNRLFLIFFKGFKAGYIRLEKSKNYFLVSWAILKKYQGKNLAKRSLKKVTANKKFKYKAIIFENNKSSENVAKFANFKLKITKNRNKYYSKN